MEVGIFAMIALLEDQDSYVYLSVLRVISQLADIDRWCVFSAMLKLFADESNTSDSNSSLSSRSPGTSGPPISVLKQNEQNVEIVTETKSIEEKERNFEIGKEIGRTKERRTEPLTLRHRSLLGEALSTVLKRAGDAAPPFVPSLVSACIRIVRVRANTVEESSVEDYVNLKTMTLSATPARERMKGSVVDQREKESLVEKNKRENIEKKEKEREGENEWERKRLYKIDIEMEMAAHNADTVLLRQSALSLLADAVVSANWIASKYLTDILDIATHVLTLEGRENFSQTSSVMKR